MKRTQINAFIDTDILFRFFAINSEKYELYKKNGTTNVKDLDKAINLFEIIQEENQNICISEISILELICLLKRSNSDKKIPKVISKIYQIGEILPINSIQIKLAWYFGSKFNLHTGDALHLAFTVSNKIDNCFICDNGFYNSFLEVKNDYIENGSSLIEDFYNNIPFSQKVPRFLISSLSNLEKINIVKI